MSADSISPRTTLPSPLATVFVVHANSDRDWVRGLLIPELGLQPGGVITPEDFTPGAPVVREFERAIAGARFTVLVLTEAFLADRWAEIGELLATHASVSGADRLIPILLEPCEIPLRVDFRVRLDCTEPHRWQSELARLRAVLGDTEPLAERIACPYPGMVAFGAHDAPFFYGREEESDTLVQRLRHHRMILVVGPSGSGKSSLIHGGLLPRLASSGGDRWLVRTMRPGAEPMQSLATALNRLTPNSAAANSSAPRVLLVVDQFEEIFTLATERDCAAFLAALVTLRAAEDCVPLLAMRADFYGELMSCELWPLGPGERLELVPLRGTRLRRAIAAPAGDVGVHLEPALVERLVHDSAEEPGALPLVQETMVLLWERRMRRLLTLRAYESLGSEGRSGLAVALATTADAALDALTPSQQVVARRILLRLVQLGEDHGDTRRQQPADALRADHEDPQVFDRVLRHLADHRLVTLGGRAHGDRTADLSHEALIRGWPVLRAWLAESRADEILRRRIERDATDWMATGRERASLYRGRRLAEAVDWSRRHQGELREHDFGFLAAGRRRRLVLLLVAATAGVAAFTGVVALAVPQLREFRWRSQAQGLGPTVTLPGGMAVIGPGRHRAAVPTVRMDVHEVTNRQYRLCVRAGRCLPPAEPYALASYDAGKWDLPVVFVTARQAANYCAWTHRRLPTETEWERAARGLNGSPYPWGSAPPDRTRVNADVGGHVPRALVPAEGAEYGAGTSRDGIVHLGGNAQEWTSTRARPDLESGRVERLGTWNGRDRVDVLLLKGGGWMLPAQLAQVSVPAAATHLDQQTGFRCAAAAD